jgi:hypothetical protein
MGHNIISKDKSEKEVFLILLGWEEHCFLEDKQLWMSPDYRWDGWLFSIEEAYEMVTNLEKFMRTSGYKLKGDRYEVCPV